MRLLLVLFAAAMLLAPGFRLRPAPGARPEIRLSDKKLVTLSFAGDCTLGTDAKYGLWGSFAEVYDQNGPDYFLENVRDIFAADDYTIVNLEGPLSDLGEPDAKEFAFKGRPEYAEILRRGSVEAVNLANNHTLDYGKVGYAETQRVLTDAEVAYYGNGAALVKEIDGIKVGIAGFRYWADTAEARAAVSAAIDELNEAGADIKIATFHWGDELAYTPNAAQQSLAHFAVDNGIDLVVGHHSHCLQSIELYKDVPILYSVGNFCFGGNRNPQDKDTIIFQPTFVFDAGALVSRKYKIIPCKISSAANRNDFRPTPADAGQAAEIKEKLLRISEGFGAEETIEGWFASQGRR